MVEDELPSFIEDLDAICRAGFHCVLRKGFGLAVDTGPMLIAGGPSVLVVADGVRHAPSRRGSR